MIKMATNQLRWQAEKVADIASWICGWHGQAVPTFKYRDEKNNYYGKYACGYASIGLNADADFETLVHELAHHIEWGIRKNSSHNQNFRVTLHRCRRIAKSCGITFSERN